jgi:hypothetical protein
VIIGVVRARVPRPEDPGEHVPAAGHVAGRTRTRPCDDRPPAPAQNARRPGWRRSQGSPARVPRPPPTPAREPPPPPPGSPQALTPRSRASPAAPSRLTRPPERRALTRERREIRHAPTAIRQHHRQLAEHPPRRMPTATLTHARQRVAQTAGQTHAIRDQRQQHRPRPRAQTTAVRRHIYRSDTSTTHHLQGEPPERGDPRLDIQILPAQADVSDLPRAPPHQSATDESS